MLRSLSAILSLATLLSSAAPVVAASAQDFVAACTGAGGSLEVCSCKAGVAIDALDERLFGFVLLSMSNPDSYARKARSGEVTPDDIAAWTTYIRNSNRACGLNY